LFWISNQSNKVCSSDNDFKKSVANEKGREKYEENKTNFDGTNLGNCLSHALVSLAAWHTTVFLVYLSIIMCWVCGLKPDVHNCCDVVTLNWFIIKWLLYMHVHIIVRMHTWY